MWANIILVTSPAGGNTGRLFLSFGWTVCADQYNIYLLGRVVTYKNLIIFAFSSVRRLDAWFPLISRKNIYSIFTKFGMGVYGVNSLHGIAFGEDRSIAN